MGIECEQLEVYQRALEFLEYRTGVMECQGKKINASDHLLRASESIPLNIAHSHAATTAKERLVYLGHANGSALECAGCLDIFAVWELLDEKPLHHGKSILREIVNMLLTMRQIAGNRVKEPQAKYGTEKSESYFDHENLQAYQFALKFISWMRNNCSIFSGSQDLMAKLDKSSTAVVLNIAEGNGRFSNPDKVKFFKIARKANTQTTALLDIAALGNTEHKTEAQEILQSTGKLISGLIRSKSL